MKRRLMMVSMVIGLAVSLAACGKEEVKEDVVATQESSMEDSNESDMASKESEETEETVEVEEKTEPDEESKEETDEKEESADIEKTTGPDEQYLLLPETQGFEFTSNGDGTCVLTGMGTCQGGDIVIPEKSSAGDVVTEIGKYAFYDAEDISAVVISGKTLKVDGSAFQSCEMEKLIISDCELEIGENAFEYCDDVSEIIIANSDVEIEKYAFYDSGKDAKVTILNCTGNVESSGFQSADIVTLAISNSTLGIGDNAFEYIDDLELVFMENSTVDIGKYAFYDSGDDMQIVLENNVIDMEENAFQSCGAISLNVQGPDIKLSKAAFEYCEDLEDVTLDGENTIEVETYAFYGCEALTDISLAVESGKDETKIVIDDMAFQSCAVVNLMIGKGNVEMGKDCFSNCDKLTSVDIKGVISSVGKYAFYGCSEEMVITYNGSTYNKDTIEDIH